MSTKPLVIAVTGANKGIGLAIVESLANAPPAANLRVIACARKPPSDSPIPSTSSTEVEWYALDITDSDSISSLTSRLRSSCTEGVDVLINNSGVNLDQTNPPGLDISKRTLETNYHGTLAVTKAFLSLMSGRPAQSSLGKRRIVTVSSVGCKGPSSVRKKELLSCADIIQINKIGERYLQSVERGRVKADGWPEGQSYSVSKAMLNAAMHVLANNHTDLLINACCPGWCKTDTGRLTGEPVKAAAEGARVPLNLAFGDLQGVSGKYWENDHPFDKGVGKPSEWIS